MPTTYEFFISVTLVGLYGLAVLSVYCLLRGKIQSPALAFAIAVPACQGIYSAFFQMRFLAQLGSLGDLLTLAFFITTSLIPYRRREIWIKDLHLLIHAARGLPWASVPLLVASSYGLLQVLVLPPLNRDALTYHMPRVQLFIQNESLFLQNFNSFHQAVFPVGSDLLFYPFIALGTDHGLAIFSWSSYLALGAACYSMARLYTTPSRSALATLVLLSLDLIVLQSVSHKNDILMAAVAGSTLALLLRMPRRPEPASLLLSAFLCAYGISIKLTFIAFLPGLLFIAFLRQKLWKPSSIRELFQAFCYRYRWQTIAILPLLLLLSQVWLFTYNYVNYGSWNGPDSFTERHQQHDGISGTSANVSRYALQLVQASYLTDRYFAPQLGLMPPTDLLNFTYLTFLEPLFGKDGATREPFHIIWAQHEDYAWFGPLGAALFFFGLPLSIRYRPRTALFALIPALIYFIVVSAQISWMPWNGRFFTAFFIGLVPALAITLDMIRMRTLLAAIAFLAIYQMAHTRLIDFQRYVIPVVSLVRSETPLTISNIGTKVIREGHHRWNPKQIVSVIQYEPRRELLKSVPKGSRVGLYQTTQHGAFAYYHLRPDLKWRPLRYDRVKGQRSLHEAIAYFTSSNIDYIVIERRFQGETLLPEISADPEHHMVLLGAPSEGR